MQTVKISLVEELPPTALSVLRAGAAGYRATVTTEVIDGSHYLVLTWAKPESFAYALRKLSPGKDISPLQVGYSLLARYIDHLKF